MDSPAWFRFSPRQADRGGGGADDEESSRGQQLEQEVPCFLDIYVHHARNIHNICIYANQDVYARFALTSAPDHAPALSTRVAAGGGASPRFDERLPPLRVRRGRIAVDVLKCELWMRSCARTLLEDQLLGFALVPLAAVAAAEGARLAARDFELSSTDLLHSPAGTVRLSLALRSDIPPGGDASPPPEPSITSEVVILETAPPTTVDYSTVEFPDLNVAKENHDMAVQYLPFLQLAEAREDLDLDMSASPSRGDGEKPASSSDGGSKNASTTTTASDDRDRVTTSPSANKAIENPPLPDDALESTAAPMSSCRSPETPTSSNVTKSGHQDQKGGDVFASPLGRIVDMDAEQGDMQRQIMEMYVRSMQQFSESLANMKMPIELAGGDGVVIQKEKTPPESIEEKRQVKNDGARVFYGSRAFF